MFDNPLVSAPLFGALAAASLPLGAMVAQVWRPDPRTLAFFMAFGGGALFAALAIELLAPALSEGHVGLFSAGALAGGCLFKGLDHLLNRRGGYLRKPATAARYWKSRGEERLRATLKNLRRLEIAADLPDESLDQLLDIMYVRDYPPGMHIYRASDPAGNLYLIERGEIELLDPTKGYRPFEHLGAHDVFGRMSFLTGMPRATEAIAVTEVRLLVLPREGYLELIESSPQMRRNLRERLGSAETRRYLAERYGLSEDQIAAWLADAAEHLEQFGRYDPPVSAPRRIADAEATLRGVRRVRVFDGLPDASVAAIARLLVPREAAAGFTFFRAGQPADRMYILSRGSIALIDPHDASGHSMRVVGGEAFGADAFVTNGTHTMTAMALEESEFYALRRKDFEVLLERDADLRLALARVLGDERTRTYLTTRQRLESDRAARWMERAVKGVEKEALYPSLTELKRDAASHQNVAMAIFLGLLLDGIPESLVIGASILHESTIGFSLIGGVFVSNFPEALSSAVGMREQGMATAKVIGMWGGMVLIAATSAFLGAVALGEASPASFSFIEGIAAGAMLTVVAETLLPEAFHKGGGIVGISTLMGFLVATLLGAVSVE